MCPFEKQEGKYGQEMNFALTWIPSFGLIWALTLAASLTGPVFNWKGEWCREAVPCAILLTRFERPGCGAGALKARDLRGCSAHRQASRGLRRNPPGRLLLSSRTSTLRGHVSCDTEFGLEGTVQLICFSFVWFHTYRKVIKIGRRIPHIPFTQIFLYVNILLYLLSLLCIYTHIHFFCIIWE